MLKRVTDREEGEGEETSENCGVGIAFLEGASEECGKLTSCGGNANWRARRVLQRKFFHDKRWEMVQEGQVGEKGGSRKEY